MEHPTRDAILSRPKTGAIFTRLLSFASAPRSAVPSKSGNISISYKLCFTLHFQHLKRGPSPREKPPLSHLNSFTIGIWNDSI
jgi:hypothetical protein